jgi:hypothetical protein
VVLCESDAHTCLFQVKSGVLKRNEPDDEEVYAAKGLKRTRTNFKFMQATAPIVAKNNESTKNDALKGASNHQSEIKEHVPVKKRFNMVIHRMKAIAALKKKRLSDLSGGCSSDDSSSYKSFGSQEGLSMQSEDEGGDFLVDFPTSREEFLEQREIEKQEHHQLDSTTAAAHPVVKEQIVNDEADQRKPWRRLTFRQPKVANELDEYEQIGFAFENEGKKKTEIDGEENDDGYDLSDHDDETSIFSELLCAQAALG